jgi:hypothetical protein
MDGCMAEADGAAKVTRLLGHVWGALLDNGALAVVSHGRSQDRMPLLKLSVTQRPWTAVQVRLNWLKTGLMPRA